MQDVNDFISSQATFHSARITEQSIDLGYYDDEFDVNIKKPFHIVRTGTAARIVDSVVDHIELANPQVFREPLKNTDKSREAALKVSRFLNYLVRHFIPELSQFTRNLILKGEAYGQVQYNTSHQGGMESCPIIFTAPDPLYIFAQPYDWLVPNQLAKSYEMKEEAVKSMFPDWEETGTRLIYKAYFDNDKKFVSIGDKEYTNTINYLGFVPFVHCYAGFGNKSYEGRPEKLAVGRLRKLRNRLREECEIESRIDSIIGTWANPMVFIKATAPDASPIDEQKLKKTVIGPGSMIIIPYGYEYQIYTPAVAAAELFQHLYQIRQALGQDIPPIMAGMASGSRTSGRLEDILYEHVQKKYSKTIDNMERALSELLRMCLKILEKTPQALPVTIRAKVLEKGEYVNKEETITKDDIEGYYNCIVKLNPEEAIEHDRKVMLGRTLVNETRISWKRFLVEYMGKTEDVADDIMAESIAEQAILTDPTMSQMRVMEAIEQAGMTKYLKQLEQQNKETREVKQAGTQYRPSEARNPLATSIIRQTLGESPKGVRNSPEEQ